MLARCLQSQRCSARADWASTLGNLTESAHGLREHAIAFARGFASETLGGTAVRKIYAKQKWPSTTFAVDNDGLVTNDWSAVGSLLTTDSLHVKTYR